MHEEGREFVLLAVEDRRDPLIGLFKGLVGRPDLHLPSDRIALLQEDRSAS